MPGWAYALIVVLVLYVVAVGTLYATGRRSHARELALLLPNLARLFHGLLRDRDVPWHSKAVIAVALAYIASPIDLIPEMIPVVGPLDDAIVASLVLGYVSRRTAPGVIERHWHGDPRVLARLLAMTGRKMEAVRSEKTMAAPQDPKPRVLFLCVRNSARSQMAEGLLRSLAPDRYDAVSAGVSAGALRPEAVTVMSEIGIDISSHRSKAATEFEGQPFDLVVTTCDEAREVCPLFPGAKRMLHWSVADPDAARGSDRMAAFRAARDDLRARIEADLLRR